VNDLDQASIGGYTLLTAGLRYTTRIFCKRATIQANLENATNKRYWSAVGSNQIGVGLGRTLSSVRRSISSALRLSPQQTQTKPCRQAH